MNLPSYRAYYVWQRDRDTFFSLWRTELWPPFIEPILSLLAMGFGLGAYVTLVDNQSYLQFLAPGIFALFPMFSASFECTYASYIRMEMQRTFDAIIATPLNIEDVIAGEIFWAATRATFTATAILVVLLAFGLLGSPLALLGLPLAFLEGLMFASIAMAFTSITPSINSFNYYFTLFITPMFYFGGVFFPLARLPQVVGWLAWFAPLNHAVNLSRSLLTGQLSWGLLEDLAWVLAVTALFFALSLVGMRRRLIR